MNILNISELFFVSGKMLSWASYLFGTSAPEPTETKEEPKQDEVAMETEAPAEKDWVVIDHSGMNLPIGCWVA